MNPKRKQRLYLIIFILLGISIAAGLILYALKQNVDFFYSPTQVVNGEAPANHEFRIGGLVKENSLQRNQHDPLKVSFIVTDRVKDLRVRYRGILPDLFKPGRDVVAQGKLSSEGEFIADEILAKHDNRYMPPEIKKMLEEKAARKLSNAP